MRNMLMSDIEMFVFDFDGVLTNNTVYLDQNCLEHVRCSRSDGLAFDVLHKLKKRACILSTEKDLVISARADKLKIIAIQGVDDKAAALISFANTKDFSLDNTLYVGNDVNDYHAMKLCGYTACPSDSHIKIKEISDIIVLKASGGNGVVRELIEEIFCIDFIELLYAEK